MDQVEYVALRDVYVAGRYIAAGDVSELDAKTGDSNPHLARVEPLPRGKKKLQSEE